MNSIWRSARVSLVPVAAGDLVVTLHPRHHQQLLEELRTLGQGIEAAGLVTARDQEIAGALGCRADERRSFHIEETRTVEGAADDADAPGTGPEIGGHAGTAQIEIAVLEPDPFLSVGTVVDHEGRCGRAVQHVDPPGPDLELAGGEIRILGPCGTVAERSLDPDAVFHAERRYLRDHRGIGHHLHYPPPVPQIEERDGTLVADPSHPSCHLHVLTQLIRSELVHEVRAVYGHRCPPPGPPITHVSVTPTPPKRRQGSRRQGSRPQGSCTAGPRAQGSRPQGLRLARSCSR